MSSLGSPNPFFIAGKKAYEVERSLRFNPTDLTNLERTFSSAGNRRTWTFSFWYKRSNIGRNTDLFGSKYGGDGANENRIYFQDNDQLRIYDSGGISGYPIVRTAAKFRDVSAWYHFVVAVDTTQSTASNRVKIYANNVLQELDETTYGNQNQQLGWNNNLRHRVGAYGNADSLGTSNINSGYMAEVNFIDGFQYDPSYFAETNAITGQWNPKKYTGSYGTNGFYLNFSDNSGTTATTLGKDSSGNGNNFTPNNFSVAAGAGNDSLEDTPTNNFCTLNSLQKDSNTTLSEGNLKAAGSSSTAYSTNTRGTFAQSSGKWYYEAVCDSTGVSNGLSMVGWVKTSIRFSDNPTGGSSVGYRPNKGDYVDFTVNNTTGKPTTSTGTVIQIAIDIDAGKIWFGSGGTYFESGDPSAGSNAARTFTAGTELAPVVRTLSATYTFNFGQRPFSYTVPTGFKALNSANLPDPTIKLPNKHFDITLYTGNGATGQSITSLQFQPDWLWFKARNNARSHAVNDSVRGRSKVFYPNLTNAEDTDGSSQGLISFDTNGFTVGQDYNAASHNRSGDTIVNWAWNAGDTDGKTYTVTVVSDSGNKYRFDGFGTSAVTLDLAEGGTYIFNYPSAHPLKFSTTADGTHGGGSEYTTGVTHNSSTQVTIVVAASAPQLYYYCSIHSGMGGAVNTNSTLGSSNFDGSIQSTVKANTSAGFSIVGYTGTNGNGTIGHGLGVAPKVVIVRRRPNASDWAIYHGEIGNTKRLVLNSNAIESNSSAGWWQNTSPTSSVVYLGNDAGLNGSTDTYIAYCFSEVEGYSKFGKYVGNSNADGTFVFLGFRPAWLMIKRSDGGSDPWLIHDSTRDPDNVVKDNIFASAADAEFDTDSVDFYANGFKWRINSGLRNNNGDNFIYFAFAEAPFKNARAR